MLRVAYTQPRTQAHVDESHNRCKTNTFAPTVIRRVPSVCEYTAIPSRIITSQKQQQQRDANAIRNANWNINMNAHSGVVCYRSMSDRQRQQRCHWYEQKKNAIHKIIINIHRRWYMNVDVGMAIWFPYRWGLCLCIAHANVHIYKYIRVETYQFTWYKWTLMWMNGIQPVKCDEKCSP